MATKKISELDSAASINSADIVPIVQNGETLKVTHQKLVEDKISNRIKNVEQNSSDPDSYENTYSCNYINNLTTNIITDGNAQKLNYKIDNKDVYVKRINCGNLPNSTSKNIAHNLSFDNITILKLDGNAYNNSTNVVLPLPFVSTSATAQVAINITNNNVVIQTGTDRSSFTAIVNIYFIYNN